MNFKFLNNDEAVSPIVATLVLIVVAIVGAAAVGTLMGTFSSDVSKQANAGDVSGTASQTILIAGSTTVQPASELLAKSYMSNHPGVKITVQGGGSGAGVSSVGMDIVDIGSASRTPTDTEMSKYPNLQSYQIGGSGVVFIVPSTTANNVIAKADLATLYDATAGTTLTTAGTTITGADIAGGVFTRAESSGTKDTASKYLFNSDSTIANAVEVTGKTGNSGMLEAVKATPNSIGYVDYGFAFDANGNAVSGIKAVSIVDGVTYVPSKTSILNGLKGKTDATGYPANLVRPLVYITNGEPSSVVKDYITYCQSPGAQADFEAAGMFALNQFQ